MFSLWDNVDPDKRDVSVVGMKKLLDQLGISYSTLYRWITEKTCTLQSKRI